MESSRITTRLKIFIRVSQITRIKVANCAKLEIGAKVVSFRGLGTIAKAESHLSRAARSARVVAIMMAAGQPERRDSVRAGGTLKFQQP
jgi:hypothetical protein